MTNTIDTTVPLEQRASYSAIIDDILGASDLNTISAKRIRKGLQDKVAVDLSDQKVRLIPLDSGIDMAL